MPLKSTSMVVTAAGRRARIRERRDADGVVVIGQRLRRVPVDHERAAAVVLDRSGRGASTARVCVPDRIVTNALSSAAFGLPSSAQLNTCLSTRVTVRRQAFLSSGSLCGPHTAVSPCTLVGGYVDDRMDQGQHGRRRAVDQVADRHRHLVPVGLFAEQRALPHTGVGERASGGGAPPPGICRATVSLVGVLPSNAPSSPAPHPRPEAATPTSARTNENLSMSAPFLDQGVRRFAPPAQTDTAARERERVSGALCGPMTRREARSCRCQRKV